MKHLLYVFLLLGAGSSTVRAQSCTFRLSGHVHSSADHSNLPGATVLLDGRPLTLVTDANGDFRFDSLCAGTYTLLLSHTSYDTVQRTIVLDKPLHLDIDLKPGEGLLREVRILAQRPGIPTPPQLSGRALEAAQGRSLGEALSRINGVTLLQTGNSVTKPVVHGLHSSRLLVINNGVRQEGQQWGNEHAPEIDPFIAGKLSLVQGVEELRYGSDAIGGAVLVEPRPLRAATGTAAEATLGYSSNDRQYLASAVVEGRPQQLSDFSWRLQGTGRRGANLTTPHYRLNNTALAELNGSATAALQREHFRTELYYSRFHTRIGLFTAAHTGNFNDFNNAIAAERPDPTFTGQDSYTIGRPRQEVTHDLLKSRTGFDAGNHKFTVLLAAQYNRRAEYDIVRSAATKGAQLDLRLLTLSQEITWEHPRSARLSGSVGLAAQQQENRYSGRYLIPNYTGRTFGAWAFEKWQKDAWELQAGLRFDHKTIDTRRIEAGSRVLTNYGFDFSTLAAAGHAGYRILPGWRVQAAASMATRAPQVNELLANGVHQGTATFEVGDIHLKPERSLRFSLNQHYDSRSKKLSVDITAYHNRIDNFIYAEPRPEDPVYTIRGIYRKVAYTATDARLQGVDAAVEVRPLDPLALTTRYALLRARDLRANDWIIGMPSDRLSQEVAWTLKEGARFSDTRLALELQHVWEQTRVPGEAAGPRDYKAPPPGYTLLHADLSTTVRAGRYPITIGLTGRNLLNTVYRDYLNAFRYFTDEMGRNLSLRIKISLQPKSSHKTVQP
ncbi:TonB-dependent receptor [Flaviaesturariibacter amylovorans]|uniref:TonB-dependent receptor n=1 Tax=Flaviaesturariibacter amylovorans TaxID=1084520 RepID=A0ABP8HNF2_9BACT